jgi:hypothetical protein
MLLAAIIGLVAASIPVLVTRGRCVQDAPPDAPRYLLLTSDRKASELRCSLGASVRLEMVASASDVERRIFDRAIAGLVLDRDGLAAAPDAMKWTSAGDGRAIVGLQLTHWELECGCPARAHELLSPDQRGESTDLVGRTFVGRAVLTRSASGTAGGRGTTVYAGEAMLGELLRSMAGPQ